MADERIERAEERIAWLERHVVEQDKAMLELGDQLRRLTRELELLRDRAVAREGATGGDDAPANERPPHY